MGIVNGNYVPPFAYGGTSGNDFMVGEQNSNVNENFYSDSGIDTAIGNGGDDTFYYAYNDIGYDSYSGGDGYDRIVYSSNPGSNIDTPSIGLSYIDGIEKITTDKVEIGASYSNNGTIYLNNIITRANSAAIPFSKPESSDINFNLTNTKVAGFSTLIIDQDEYLSDYPLRTNPKYGFIKTSEQSENSIYKYILNNSYVHFYGGHKDERVDVLNDFTFDVNNHANIDDNNKHIRIHTELGDDFVRIKGMLQPDIDLGGGDDTIQISDNIAVYNPYDIIFKGGAGYDSLEYTGATDYILHTNNISGFESIENKYDDTVLFLRALPGQGNLDSLYSLNGITLNNVVLDTTYLQSVSIAALSLQGINIFGDFLTFYQDDLAFSSEIIFSKYNDVILMNDGDDVVYAGDGDDIINGGVGNDVLYGENGNDIFEYSLGSDTLNGGDGDDTAIYAGLITDYEFTFESLNAATNLQVENSHSLITEYASMFPVSNVDRNILDVQVVDKVTGDTNHLIDIEFYEFSDGAGGTTRISAEELYRNYVPPLPQDNLVWDLSGGIAPGNYGQRVGVNMEASLQKTHAMSFTTGSDIETTQVVYEQGGDVNGLSFLIQNGKLYASVWGSAGRNISELGVNIEANTAYTASFVIDGTSNVNQTQLYLNGNLVDIADGIGEFPRNIGYIGIGEVAGNTIVDGVRMTKSSPFLGDIEALAHYDTALSGEALEALHAHLAHDYLSEMPETEQVIMEFGSVQADHNVVTVDLEHDFLNPVVLMTMTTFNGGQLAVPRITDVENGSFSFYAQEADYLDGAHAVETFSYIVVEAGSWTLSDGTKLEAGVFDTDQMAWTNFETVSFNTSFDTNPVVLSHVQTNNDVAFVDTRQKEGDQNGFKVALQEEESANRGSHDVESIGWLAIEAGSGEDDGHSFTALTTDDAFTHN